MIRVLWVDDEAYGCLSALAAHAVMAGDLELTIATTEVEARAQLAASDFDAVVFDLCLSPGQGGDAQDGLTLLAAYLAREFPLRRGARKVPTRCIGVMTVDIRQAVREALLALGIEHIVVKSSKLAPDALTHMARRLARSGPAG